LISFETRASASTTSLLSRSNPYQLPPVLKNESSIEGMQVQSVVDVKEATLQEVAGKGMQECFSGSNE
jgi:hypothetical protein